MNELRTLSTALAGLLLLGATTAAIATAEEEEPPMPPAGDPFAGLISGSASFPPDDECPFGVRTVVDATGVTTLGQVSFRAEHCATLGAPTVPAGRMTMTVEGGDQISGQYYVDCHPPLPTMSGGELITCPGRFVFVTGTGAFAEVTGTARTSSYVWFPGSLEVQAWPWIAELHGSISY